MAGKWSIIVPEAETNYAVNPAFELDASSHTDDSDGTATGTRAVATDWVRRGGQSYKLVKTGGASGDVWGAYIDVASADLADWPSSGFASALLSIDVNLTVGAAELVIEFEDPTNGVFNNNTVIATPSTKRYSLSVNWATTGTPLYIRGYYRIKDAATGTLYVDGIMLSIKNYATSYFDGSSPRSWWNGAEFASTSTHTAQARQLGREFNFDTYSFFVESVIGAGMPPAQLLTHKQALLDGDQFITQRATNRTITLSGIQTGTSLTNLHSNRKSLIDVLKRDVVAPDQAFVLRYTGADDDIPVEILVRLARGLEGGAHEGFNERELLRFIAHEPLWHEDGNDAAHLTTSQSLTSSNRIIEKRDNVWANIGTGANNTVKATVYGPDGTLYIGGSFTSFNGVANTAYICKWDGTTITAMGTGMNQEVEALAMAPNGDLYATGDFSLAGGVANTAYIARWDGGAWNPLGTGLDAIGGLSLTVGNDNVVYVGGNFSGAGGVANTTGIAKWDGSAWSALGTGGGVTHIVWGLDTAPNGDIYATGNFLDMGGVTDADRVAKWDGTSWIPLLTGIGNGVGNAVLVAPNNDVYFTGSFTNAGGVANADRIVLWNGVKWVALGTGLDNTGTELALDVSDNLTVAGSLQAAGARTNTNGVALWNGSTWAHFDVDSTTSFVGSALAALGSRAQVFAHGNAATVETGAITTVTNNGTATAYPKFVLRRSGGTSAALRYIRNETTGDTLFLDYDLLDGETVTLDFTPGNKTAESSFFSNILSGVLRNSDFGTFRLQPGDNDITVFVYEVGSPTLTCFLQWPVTHWSYDGVAT